MPGPNVRSRLNIERANNNCVGLSSGFHELHLRIEKVVDGGVVDDKDERLGEDALNGLEEQRQASAVEGSVIRAERRQPMTIGIGNVDFSRSVHGRAREFLGARERSPRCANEETATLEG
jgi:hypothetical protein